MATAAVLAGKEVLGERFESCKFTPFPYSPQIPTSGEVVPIRGIPWYHCTPSYKLNLIGMNPDLLRDERIDLTTVLYPPMSG